MATKVHIRTVPHVVMIPFVTIPVQLLTMATVTILTYVTTVQIVQTVAHATLSRTLIWSWDLTGDLRSQLEVNQAWKAILGLKVLKVTSVFLEAPERTVAMVHLEKMELKGKQDFPEKMGLKAKLAVPVLWGLPAHPVNLVFPGLPEQLENPVPMDPKDSLASLVSLVFVEIPAHLVLLVPKDLKGQQESPERLEMMQRPLKMVPKAPPVKLGTTGNRAIQDKMQWMVFPAHLEFLVLLVIADQQVTKASKEPLENLESLDWLVSPVHQVSPEKMVFLEPKVLKASKVNRENLEPLAFLVQTVLMAKTAFKGWQVTRGILVNLVSKAPRVNLV